MDPLLALVEASVTVVATVEASEIGEDTQTAAHPLRSVTSKTATGPPPAGASLCPPLRLPARRAATCPLALPEALARASAANLLAPAIAEALVPASLLRRQ
jgi:hypothetical protein